MPCKVFVKKSVLKNIAKLPAHIQQKLVLLIELSADQHHCHLARKWVACWRMEEGTIEIEVYYAGSRENAPY